MSEGLQFSLAGEAVALLHERALWWPSRKTLFITDTHFGKAATFRAHGIPLGDHSLERDLERLTTAVRRTASERVVILGDLLHARRGRAPETLARISRWRAGLSALAIQLVPGNHDRAAGPPLDDWHMEFLPNGHLEGPFEYQHSPTVSQQGYVLAGHLHPKAVLRLGAGGEAKLPCLWIRPAVAILPAFGSLIDSAAISPSPDDRVLAITDHDVHDVTGLFQQRRLRRPMRRGSPPAGTARPEGGA